MLYHLLYPLRDVISFFNIFRYVNFRSIFAMITALVISFVLGPIIIKGLKRCNIVDSANEDRPETHQKKAGTPIMGGVIILLAIVSATLLWADFKNGYVQVVLFSVIWMSAVGFADDYLKVTKKRNGLIESYKWIGSILLGLIVGLGLYFKYQQNNQVLESTFMPFFKNLTITLPVWIYLPLVVVLISLAVHSVNLTDGLDGLAAGLSAIAFITYAVFTYVFSHSNWSRYFDVIYLPGCDELTIFCFAVSGACIGFLWFNVTPAMIFMGDVGSLALGGALAVVAVLTKTEILLGIIGAVFAGDALSALIQRIWFKITRKRTGKGRRIFLCAPIHHHFEKKGWSEPTIVVRFWIVGIFFALLSLSLLKIR